MLQWFKCSVRFTEGIELNRNLVVSLWSPAVERNIAVIQGIKHVKLALLQVARLIAAWKQKSNAGLRDPWSGPSEPVFRFVHS